MMHNAARILRKTIMLVLYQNCPPACHSPSIPTKVGYLLKKFLDKINPAASTLEKMCRRNKNMKKSKRLNEKQYVRNGMAIATIAFALTQAGLAADLVIAGTHPVTVASGDTTVISDKVTGPGALVVLGGGTLVLNNGNNDFIGGIIVSNGVLRADAAGCLGEGPISLEGNAAIRQIQFNANGAVFGNDITLKDASTTKTHPAIVASKTVTLNGSLSTCPDTTSLNLYIQPGSATDNNAFMTINGPVSVVTGNLWAYVYGSMRFNGKIKTERMRIGEGWANNGQVSLANPENEIANISLYNANLLCLATNVMRGCSFCFAFSGDWVSNGYGFLNLNGYDQIFSRIYSQHETKLSPTDYGCGITTPANSPATITCCWTGDAAYVYLETRIDGPVSFVIDGNGNLSQGIRRRMHRGYGSIDLRKGRFRCINGATMPNVTNVTIASGCRFDLTSVTNVFERLETLRIKGTGEFLCDESTTAPLSLAPISNRVTDVIMDSTATFHVRTGVTNTIDHLVIGDNEIRTGLYTYETLPQMRHSSNQSAYAGALVVSRHHRSMTISFR